MRIHRLFVITGVLIAAPAAQAQICNGNAPFANGPLRIGAAVNFYEDGKTFGPQVALGGKNVFGGVEMARYSFDDLPDSKATTYGAHLGYSVAVGTSQRLEICPMAFAQSLSSELVSPFGNADVTGKAYGAGMSVGGVASTSPNIDFMPFGSVLYGHGTTEVTFAGTTEKSSDDSGLLTLGAGFVIRKLVTVLPSVSIPFGNGDDDADPSYGIVVAVNLGKKRP